MSRTIWIDAIRAVAMVVALPVVAQVLGQGVATAATIPPSSVSTISVSTEFDTRTSKRVVATCPANKRIVGGGAQVVGETQHVVLTRQEPVVSTFGDSYEVEAIKDPIGSTTTWSLTALAFCADPPPGLEIVRASVPTDRANDVAGAFCPRGKSVVGMGGQINGGENRVTLATSGVLSVGFAHGFNPFDGLGHPYIMTASAACVSPTVMSDLQVASGNSDPTPPGGRQFAQATCPAGMRATGGAAFAVPPVVIESVLPDPSRTQIQAVARNDGAVAGGSVRVFAFCAS